MGLAPDPQYFEDKSCGCCTVGKTVASDTFTLRCRSRSMYRKDEKGKRGLELPIEDNKSSLQMENALMENAPI